jgi:uncharacterized protein Yka (UPF0111/DUF47 family)
MSRPLRKNDDYFALFDTGMALAHKAALQLQASIAGGVIRDRELKQIRVTKLESAAHVRRCLEAVDIAFVTPFDRLDIVELIRKIDRLTGSIDAVADRLYILQVKKADVYLLGFAESIVKASRTLKTLTGLLRQYKKNRKKIVGCILEIGCLEKEGDTLFGESVSRLFARETDAIRLIRQKDLYQLMQSALDSCGDIARAIEAILIAKT